MPKVETTAKINASKKKFFEIITSYEQYPDFVPGLTKVNVERKGAGRARVTYFINVIKEISYTLEHEEDADAGLMKWKLVESNAVSKNEGTWKVTEKGPNEAEASYSLDIEFKIPVPGFILKGLLKSQFPQMIASFEKRAQA